MFFGISKDENLPPILISSSPSSTSSMLYNFYDFHFVSDNTLLCTNVTSLSSSSTPKFCTSFVEFGYKPFMGLLVCLLLLRLCLPSPLFVVP